MTNNPVETIHSQPSYTLAVDNVELAMTRNGAHMAPVAFFRQTSSPFLPYHIAPWADEEKAPETPDILHLLRGDFFCCPFGGNDAPYEDEQHPIHGQTAGESWALEGGESGDVGAWMRLGMDLTVRAGRVEKFVALAAGQNCVYTSDVISGMSGKINFGHHATLGFPDVPECARISFAPRRHAQVYYNPTENPEDKGYSILKPGALIDDLTRVPRIDGVTADLTRYPARRGYEDIAIVCTEEGLPFGWTAVVYETLGYVWFSLKDPKVLPSTLMWHSNGGRHYEPWSGRNINCLGLEDILGYFHDGIAGSVADNDLAARGVPTCREMDPAIPVAVNYIQGAAQVPAGFGAIVSIEANGDAGVVLTGESGATVEAPVCLGFLESGKLKGLGG